MDSLLPSMKDKPDTPSVYAAYIHYTRTPFSQSHVIEAIALDEAQATRLCEYRATQVGWKPPSWWQWWRRRDSVKPASGPRIALGIPLSKRPIPLD